MKNWCGWRPRSEEQKKEYIRKLLKDKEGSLNDLYVVQEQIEEAARKIAHFTKGRKKIMKQTPEEVKIREKAAARCSRLMERRVLSKQARRARADHLVTCQYGTRSIGTTGVPSTTTMIRTFLSKNDLQIAHTGPKSDELAKS